MAGQGEAHFESRDRYEKRPFVSDTRYWRERESHRFSPYQVPSRREGEGESSSGERGEEKGARRGVPENKVFVANLSYSVNWQTLKDHMKKGNWGRGPYFVRLYTQGHKVGWNSQKRFPKSWAFLANSKLI